MLLMVALVWGTTFIVVQNALDLLPPHSFNAIRFLTASVIVLFLAVIFDKLGLRLGLSYNFSFNKGGTD